MSIINQFHFGLMLSASQGTGSRLLGELRCMMRLPTIADLIRIGR